MKYTRTTAPYRSVAERTSDYKELIAKPMDKEQLHQQAARCMDCGVPFCHHGCPLGNIIPEFNDAVYNGEWEEAIRILSMTNNFPEFTGRICPAPCEASCVLSINNQAVTIEYIEKTIAETAFEKGYIKPSPPAHRTGKRVAVIGSGPAGLAAAAQLNKAGHWVVVLERNDRIGGLLRYGIPDFKLDKHVLDRRLAIMEREGIIFRPNTNVGVNVSANYLYEEYDAVVITTGSTLPRDLSIPGRSLKGVHAAMDFLTQQNKRVAGDKIFNGTISATSKNVLVIGGGDTGSDCVGTSIRQGAKSVTQIELLAKPPLTRREDNPWPLWPFIFTTSSSQEEGVERQWAVLTKEFVGTSAGNLSGIKLVNIEWGEMENGRMGFKEIENTERIVPCELALLAIGFAGPERAGLVSELGLELDERGNIRTTHYMTSQEGVFAAGDARRGQSLVVWAISEGREAARAADEWLMQQSSLERKDKSMLTTADAR